MRSFARQLVLAALASALGACTARTPEPAARRLPSYQHIFVIIAENKGFDQLMDHPQWTPVIHQLASDYGTATQFYAEVHPSEANYIAMLGGDTFGIHDDDAFYCHAGLSDPDCEKSKERGYANHDLAARSLMDQLDEKGLSWKAYLEDIPSPGSLMPRWPTPDHPSAGLPNDLYAGKHNGFVNFRSVNRASAPELSSHFVGFHQLDEDLASERMPNYAHIVPNQCNDMHGLGGAMVPDDCKSSNLPALIRRGDKEIGLLVSKIMHSKMWSSPGNSAIVITFDEDDKSGRAWRTQGCCGYESHSVANFGGGHILTIVITNHGPRHLADDTPYNHYSLLRTTEAAFGISQYLGRAADSSKGVVTMAPLFAVTK